MIKLIDKNLYKLNLYYSIFVAIYCSCSLLIPFQLISSNSIIKTIFIGMGVFLATYNLIIKKSYIKVRELKWLILFLIADIITMLLNINYGYVNNIKDAMVFYIYFFCIYSGLLLLSKQEALEIIKRFFYLIFFFLTFGATISLFQFLNFKSYYEYNYKGMLVRQGFVENRLFGIFIDPNYLSIILIICSIYIYILSRKLNVNSLQKFIIYVSIVIDYIYVVLSGSRTAFLILIIISLCIFIYIYIYSKNKKTIIKFLFIFLTLFTSYYGIKNASNYYLKINNDLNVSKKVNIENLTLDRIDTSEENISNNRFKIWQGMLELIPNKPIFGVSSGNWYEVSKEYDSKNYIVEQKYLSHNGYLEMLFYNGIIGLAFMTIFMIKNFIIIIKNINNSSNINIRNYNFSILLIFVIILFSNLLLSATFYGIALLGFILLNILAASKFMAEDRELKI